MLQTQKYMVGYIDLLAGKSLITQDRENQNLNAVYKCYCVAKQIVDLQSSYASVPYSVKIFSDNIIVAIPSDPIMLNDNHPVIALNRIAAIVGAFQRAFLAQGILTRGSITYGDLYIDDLMVWGSALVEAYEIESFVANYPRVVLSEKILQLGSLYSDGISELLQINNIKQDIDGEYYIDYLNYPLDTNVQQLISSSLQSTEEKIASEQKHRILQKYQWHKNYLLSLSSTSN